MRINQAGLDLIKSFEGCEFEAYTCPAGKLTIGYGHTSDAGPPEVRKGMRITQADADDILAADLIKYEAAVDGPLTRIPNENQFAAMVSLCYNIGRWAFRKSSVLRHFNAGKFEAASNSFALWNKITTPDGQKVVSRGLVRRRKAEADLFLTPVDSIPAPPDIEPIIVPEPSRVSFWRWLFDKIWA